MIIYGKQLFLHVLKRHFKRIIEVYLAKDIEKPLFNEIVKTGAKIIRVDNKKAQALAAGGNHQGLLAKIEPVSFCDINELKQKDFIAVLYGLSDVGNIGAISRTAYALGCDGLAIVGKSANLAGILRSSSGAALELPIALVPDGLSLLNELKQVGFSLYATAAGGKNVSLVKFDKKLALVLGSEGDGLSAKVIAKCDKTVGVRLKNGFDSLNVSAAFAIICDRIVNE
ncbi:23S rRNA (guanosine(2251)-2'-O)-methyltransferase RlmB [Campylobacter sp. 19-13652]|uniref:23S rRNA (guanosine(2251)-2'-O)-methyltransferase RlmB n=1 Tax=Campylobacter sp. 19-13652 TaxID=2840180 RepID=UPI001C772D65|nr:23S rRNA (guanosine(2251)-2'-O)-methyltransferase RlmB [Campylobacter sp. 19-13652]BCX80115.1 23S rRNA (guanosine(2251)-2'-O)-methyltransferase RlmB [Campylobacter sp. 19-13652]